MAIDTASKRFSMMNFVCGPTYPLFVPDGTVAEGDRLHLLDLYSGIATEEPPPGIEGTPWNKLKFIAGMRSFKQHGKKRRGWRTR